MSKRAIPMLPIVILVVMACNLVTNTGSEQEEPITPSVNTPSSVTESPAALSGETFTDTRVGFTFTYPEGWTLIAPQNIEDAVSYSYTMQSFEPPAAGSEGFPEGESKIDIHVNPTDTTSLENIRARLGEDEANNDVTIHDEQRVTLGGGLAALVIQATGFQGGSFTGIYTVINGHEVALIGLGEDEYVWQVANSLRAS